MREIRLLMTTDTRSTSWGWATELAAALRPHGVRTTLAAMGEAPHPRQLARARAVPDLELHLAAYAVEWMDDPWEDVHRAGQWLLDLEQRVEPDLVQLGGYAHGAWPFRAPKVVVAHGCACSRYEALHGVEAPRRYGRYRLRVCAGLQGARLVVAPTRWMLDTLEAQYGAPRRAVVIPHGVAAGDFSGSKLPRIAVSADSDVLPVLGDLAVHSGWTLAVVAEEPTEGALAETAVLVHTVPYDPFGRIALRGAAAGCALVLADVPALREVWGDDALYVPPGDPAAAHEVVEELITDPAHRRDLARRARARVRLYDLAVTASAWRDTYEAVLAHTPARHVRLFPRPMARAS